MEAVQPQWYSEEDFARAEARVEAWRSLRQHDRWPEFAASVEGMLFGWRSSLETLAGADISRAQGMIAGAKAVFALLEGKIQEQEAIIAGMQAQNDSISQARTEREDGN